MTNITVRYSVASDLSELARLAALDSATPPRGPALIAEADSRMLAALPMGSGRPIADPFEPTGRDRGPARAAQGTAARRGRRAPQRCATACARSCAPRPSQARA